MMHGKMLGRDLRALGPMHLASVGMANQSPLHIQLFGNLFHADVHQELLAKD
jgi:hypothetical protein